MNKYLLPLLCIASMAHAAEEQQQIVKREAREWDAAAYAAGNFIQETAALKFLQESGIDLTNKKVIDIGCGTGNISAKMACYAQKVHGIDASKNMIEYAQKTFHEYSNLTFEHCFAEDFVPKEKYNAAVSFFCLSRITALNTALQNINRALSNESDFFGITQTTEDPQPLGVNVGLELILKFCSVEALVNYYSTLQEEIGISHSSEQFKQMLSDAGFECTSLEHKAESFPVSREQLEIIYKPLLTSISIIRDMTEETQNNFFKQFIDLYITKVETNDDGLYISPFIASTVFHARKIADV